MSCHVMSCHVMSCHVMSCHVMSCHVMWLVSVKRPAAEQGLALLTASQLEPSTKSAHRMAQRGSEYEPCEPSECAQGPRDVPSEHAPCAAPPGQHPPREDSQGQHGLRQRMHLDGLVPCLPQLPGRHDSSAVDCEGGWWQISAVEAGSGLGCVGGRAHGGVERETSWVSYGVHLIT